MTLRLPHEVDRELSEQREVIITCGEIYDSGSTHFAKVVATAVNTICFDGRGNSKGLLTQAGLKGAIPFVSSAIPLRERNLVPVARLVIESFSASGIKYLPRLGDRGVPYPYAQLSFDDWWNEPVFVRHGSEPLSRGLVIRHLRDQDGGAHYDAELKSEAYVHLRNRGMDAFMMSGPNAGYAAGAHLATARQIGWELERSLSDALS